MQESGFPKIRHYVGFWQIGSQLVQYVITAKDLFKTRIYTLEVIHYRILKTLGSLIVHCIDWPIELVATNHLMPPVINHKNILKPKMNPHKFKYT